MDQLQSRCNRSTLVRLLVFIVAVVIITLASLKPDMVFSFTSLNRSENVSSSMNIAEHVARRYCLVFLQDRAGRLGNRMFMSASAYGLARLHSCYLYLSPEIINEMRTFFSFDFSPLLISSTEFTNLTGSLTSPMKPTAKYVVCGYVPELTRPNAIPTGSRLELTGFWQSYLHFAKYSDEFRERIFVGKPSIVEKVSQFFLQIYQQKLGYHPQLSLNSHLLLKTQLRQSANVTWIGIHVRRGDFQQLQFASSDVYLLNATSYFTSLYPDAHFIVGSDDKPYCANFFRNQSNVFLLPSSFSSGDDMIALSACEHSIITGGTFGWWAAFLANGQVYHDTVYPSGCQRREYYYPPWFLIDGHVRENKNSNYTL